MATRRRKLVGILAVASLLCAPWATSFAAPEHDRIVAAVPSAATPAVNDGDVFDIRQVGDVVIAGGSFTSVSSPGGNAQPRTNVMAFNASTGQVSNSFNPDLNGVVESIHEGPSPNTVYLAGSFNRVNGSPASHVVLLNINTGQVANGFRAASTNGKINTVDLVNDRLLIGGNFTTAGGVTHQGLASLDPQTGALDDFMGIDVSQRHNDSGSGAQGAVGVREMEATSDGQKLVAIGNFKRADGLSRDQAMIVDLSGTHASVNPNWRTRRFEPYCFNWAFDTYVRGVSVAPDNSYFVITATGGHNGNTLCDTASRWEFSATGDNVQPTWVEDTGGDTLWGVEVAESAVYVGGHQRWLNNPTASDRAGQGAVPRPGIAALDPTSGLPVSWNPGRNPRGAAVYAMHATPDGLWVGSDTEWIGNRTYRRQRIARFPLAGGQQQPSDATRQLPGDVYLGGQQGTVDQGNVVQRVNAGGPGVDAIDGGPPWLADDQVNSSLRNNNSNAALYDPTVARHASLPAHVPSSLFDSERWSPNDSPRMSWAIPAPNGAPLQVRLFFANRYTGTSQPGQRVFDVSLEGNVVLDDFDIAQAVGDQTGMMRSFDITSDGTVNIDFSHVTENPLINGIEIVRRDLPPPSGSGADTLKTISFDGTTAGAPTTVNGQGIDWSNVRGAFLAGDTLFYGRSDGYLYRRSFVGGTAGPAVKLDPYNDPYWSDVSTGSGNTFRGALPAYYGQLSNVTGVFYWNGRIYYTLRNDSNLYWRKFNVDSGIVGADQFTASGGQNWSGTGGLFLSGTDLYVVTSSNGALRRISFTNGTPTGGFSTANTTRDWRARAQFIGVGSTPNTPPTASFTVNCTGLACALDASASSDAEGAIDSYVWDFGDGGTSSGAQQSHSYGAAGDYEIKLTVEDADGVTDTATKSIHVEDVQLPDDSAKYAASNSASLHNTNPSVTVPNAVEPGDQLVMVGTYGVADAGPSTPSGWTLVDSRVATGASSFVWTRRATASDAGSSVATPLQTLAKSTLIVAAYRGVAATSPVAAIASSVDNGTSHVSPTVTLPENALGVQIWTDKSSGTTAWTLPSGNTIREESYGAGGGRTTGICTDSEAGMPAGQFGGVTGQTDHSSGRAIAWTLALRSAS